MDNDSYLLLLLSDGNLPTGSFVSSSGLESYFKHGFPAVARLSLSDPSASQAPVSILGFIKDSLAAYARLALPFASDAHAIMEDALESSKDPALALQTLDRHYEAMSLNHITRRASKAQGVALLTLFSKGFSRPTWLDALDASQAQPAGARRTEEAKQRLSENLVDGYKLMIRRGEVPGHLPICWGVLSAALSLSSGKSSSCFHVHLLILTERSEQLFLFLYARSLLSAAIRLNTIGPYAAQQLLLHAIRQMVDEEVSNCSHLTSRSVKGPGEGEDWSRLEQNSTPATTWPLGEILAARHDLQHSRIFNS